MTSYIAARPPRVRQQMSIERAVQQTPDSRLPIKKGICTTCAKIAHTGVKQNDCRVSTAVLQRRIVLGPWKESLTAFLCKRVRLSCAFYNKLCYLLTY